MKRQNDEFEQQKPSYRNSSVAAIKIGIPAKQIDKSQKQYFVLEIPSFQRNFYVLPDLSMSAPPGILSSKHTKPVQQQQQQQIQNSQQQLSLGSNASNPNFGHSAMISGLDRNGVVGNSSQLSSTSNSNSNQFELDGLDIGLQIFSKNEKDVTFAKCEKCQTKDSSFFSNVNSGSSQSPIQCFALIDASKIPFIEGNRKKNKFTTNIFHSERNTLSFFVFFSSPFFNFCFDFQ